MSALDDSHEPRFTRPETTADMRPVYVAAWIDGAREVVPLAEMRPPAPTLEQRVVIEVERRFGARACASIVRCPSSGWWTASVLVIRSRGRTALRAEVEADTRDEAVRLLAAGLGVP